MEIIETSYPGAKTPADVRLNLRRTIETLYASVDVSEDVLAKAPADMEQRLETYFKTLDTHLYVCTGYRLLSELRGQAVPPARMLFTNIYENPSLWLEVYDGLHQVLLVSSALNSGQARNSYLVYSPIDGIVPDDVWQAITFKCTVSKPKPKGKLNVVPHIQPESDNPISLDGTVDAILAGISLHKKASQEPRTLRGLGVHK